MTNAYLALKQKHEEEFSAFPIVFAFNKNQFEEAMEKLGFSVSERDYVGSVVSINGGGFIRKTDSEAFQEMLDRHENEMDSAIEGDPTGDGFIFDMFRYELANHEYGYTQDPEQTLDALGLNWDDINANGKLKYALNKAIKDME